MCMFIMRRGNFFCVNTLVGKSVFVEWCGSGDKFVCNFPEKIYLSIISILFS
jgi:hypothetical protein